MISQDFENKLIQLMQQYPDAVLKVWAIEWEKHIHNNFETAGAGKWEPKFIDDGRAILTGKSGLLKSSTTVEADLVNKSLIAGSGVDYSQVHQEGATIPVTDKMRKYFWAKFKETKNVKWKYLALMKKKFVTIPARPFITVTDSLMNTFTKAAEELLKIYTR